jgi:epoxyqueuosine reductase QueG
MTEVPVSLAAELRNDLLSKGASVVGFAGLEAVPAGKRSGFPYGIVIGAAVDPEIVRKIYPGPSIEYYNEYNALNALLNQLGEYTAAYLIAKGYDASAQTQGAVKVDRQTIRSELPHKTIATLAGMGWIGKCSLLVTKEFGSAIRISTVLTNAHFETGEPIHSSACGSCCGCETVCPAGAISGKNWNVDLDRDDFFNPAKCKGTMIQRGSSLGLSDGTCSLCMWNCPWTKRYVNSCNAEC